MNLFISKTTQAKWGFTIMEVMIAIALLISIAVVTMPFLSNTLSQNELDAAVQGVVDALNEARSSASNGKGDGLFGVHFESDSYTLFVGESYLAEADDNATHNLSELVSITDIDIDGGGEDLVFSSASGAPDQTGTIQLVDSTGETLIVSVNAAGTVEVQ